MLNPQMPNIENTKKTTRLLISYLQIPDPEICKAFAILLLLHRKFLRRK